MPGSRFAARLKEQDFVSSKLDPLSWANASRLIGGCGTLIQLCKAHADSHRMLQVLLGTPLDTGLLLLVQSLPPETFHAVTEAPLHQGIVHFQAVTNLKLVDHEGHTVLVLLRQRLKIGWLHGYEAEIRAPCNKQSDTAISAIRRRSAAMEWRNEREPKECRKVGL